MRCGYFFDKKLNWEYVEKAVQIHQKNDIGEVGFKTRLWEIYWFHNSLRAFDLLFNKLEGRYRVRETPNTLTWMKRNTSQIVRIATITLPEPTDESFQSQEQIIVVAYGKDGDTEIVLASKVISLWAMNKILEEPKFKGIPIYEFYYTEFVTNLDSKRLVKISKIGESNVNSTN